MSGLFEQAVAITKEHAERYDNLLVEAQRRRIHELEDRVYDLETKLRESENECDELRDEIRDLRARRL